jgi:hypothetical protein
MDGSLMVRLLLIAIASREFGHTLRSFNASRKKKLPLSRRRRIGYVSAVSFALGAVLVALGYLWPGAERVGWLVCGGSLLITTATPCSYACVNEHGTVFVLRNIAFALQGGVCIWYGLVGFVAG